MLLLEELHRGNFKLRSLGFLGGRQQIADVLRAGFFFMLTAVTHKQHPAGIFIIRDFDFICAFLHQVGRHLRRVIVGADEHIGNGDLETVTAGLAGFHAQQFACFILGQKPGIPAVNAFGLVKFLRARDHIIKMPDKIIAIERQNLCIDGFFPAVEPWHDDVLGIDVLSRFARGSVAALRDAHDFTRNTKMLKHGIPEEPSPLRHIHVAHVLGQLRHGHVAVHRGNAVGVERSPEALIPFGPETVALILTASRHRDQRGRSGIVVEELLLEFCRVLVRLDLICKGLCRTETSFVGVKRVQFFHAENIVHRDLPDESAGRSDFIVGVAHIGGLLHPMCRERPQLHRTTEGIKFIDEVALALEFQIDLLQPPARTPSHFIEGVRMRHEIQKGMVRDFHFFPVFILAVQLTGAGGQVGSNAIHNRQTRVAAKHFQPVPRIALRRRSVPGQHNADVPAIVLPPNGIAPSESKYCHVSVVSSYPISHV